MKKRIRSQIIAAILVLTVLVTIPHCKKKIEIPKLTGEIDYNLLVITLDTTRADRIGAYGYPLAETPNIDNLAQNGVMFESCYASVPLTLPSHVTLFTGREPIAHHVRNNGTYVLGQDEATLAEVMKGHAFQTYAVISSFILHSKFGLNQGFDHYDDSLDFATAANNVRTEIRADKVYSRFKDWFDKNYSKTFFCWVHFYDPHSPYDPPAEYKRRFSNDYYDGEVAYMDLYVGKIVEDLKAKDILNKTLIIIVGDHGEAFGEHKEQGHGIFCYEESLKVPLIFYNPEVFEEKNRIISRRVCLADIFPTVLQLFDIERPNPIQGKSLALLLFGEEEDERAQIYIESLYGKEDMGWAPLTGMILGDFKYISLPTPELYDLANDPEEKENLFIDQTSVAREIDEELREYIQRHSESDTPYRRELSEEDRRRLESLGYVLPFSEKSKESIDPKEGIDLMNEVLAVKELFEEGRVDEAEKKLIEMKAEGRGVRLPMFYDNLSNMYKNRGDMERAIEVLEEAVEQFPEKKRYRMNLALFYLQVGKSEEAEKLCLALIEDHPDTAQAYSVLGIINIGRGEIDKAVFFYEKARKIEPLNVLMQIYHAEAELERGNPDSAIEITDALLKNEVLMHDPDSSKVRIRMGVLLARAGEYDSAIELFLRIIENKKANAEVWTHLGLSYFNKGDFKKALESYNESLELEEKNALTLSSLGTLYLTLFRAERNAEYHSRAIDFYRKALESNPSIASAHNGLGIAYRFIGKNDLAISHWKKAIAAKPDFTNAYINLGITLMAVGQKEEALEYLTACKEKYFSRLSDEDQKQLLELLAEAGVK